MKKSENIMSMIVFAKVNSIDTGRFIIKTKYDTDKWSLERKIVIRTKKFLILVGLFKKGKIYKKR